MSVDESLLFGLDRRQLLVGTAAWAGLVFSAGALWPLIRPKPTLDEQIHQDLIDTYESIMEGPVPAHVTPDYKRTASEVLVQFDDFRRFNQALGPFGHRRVEELVEILHALPDYTRFHVIVNKGSEAYTQEFFSAHPALADSGQPDEFSDTGVNRTARNHFQARGYDVKQVHDYFYTSDAGLHCFLNVLS